MGATLSEDESDLIDALPTGRKLQRLLQDRFCLTKRALEEALMDLYETALEDDRKATLRAALSTAWP